MKKLSIALCLLLWLKIGMAQSAGNASFADYQRNFPKISEILRKKEDTLRKQFQEKGLEWPAKYMYLRSFKYDSQLEVWVKGSRSESYRHFKTYKVCAMAGTLGPKRMEGDYQVPEGFYYINEFNPRSVYHLSLGLNYPNASDRFLSDAIQPGGDIYIHGSCVTTGCIPITDPQIEELYILATYSKSAGQDFIPVHIFPVKFDNPKSVDYLNRYLRDFSEYTQLADRLKEVYFYFEKNRQLPVIMVNNKGSYVLDAEVKKAMPSAAVEEKTVPVVQVVKKNRERVDFDEREIPNTVNRLPEYPGGNEAFKKYLRSLNRELSGFLNEDQHTAYVLVEFIVTHTGKVVNPRVLRGGNDLLNEKLLDALEVMPDWTPAERQDRNVPMKLKQTILIENKPGLTAR